MLKIIRKALPIVLALSLTGCATYTVQEGLSKMDVAQGTSSRHTTTVAASVPAAEEPETREQAEAEAQAAADAIAEAEARAQEAQELAAQSQEAEAQAQAEAEEAARLKQEAEARLQAAADEQAAAAEAAAAEAAAAELQAALDKAEAERTAREQAEAERLAAESAMAEAEAKAAEAERILNEIAEAEAQAQAEAERAAQAAEIAAAEAERERLEAEQSRNDYPEDLSLITYPHIYRPANSNTELSSTFTRVNVILIPLTDKEYTEDEISRIAAAIKDIPEEFIFLTGSDRNLIEVSKLIGRDSVLLEGGMIIFTPRLKSANAKSAVFTLCEGKDVAMTVVDIYDEMAEAASLDIAAWQTYLAEKSASEIALTDEYIDSMTGTVRIMALSSSEPSSEDWTIFTPYEYREDHEWQVSEYIASEGWSDTYRATHFSEETDGGITLETSSISERLDFLYTMNLMQVSSSTITLPVLSTGSVKRFATAALYIIP